MRSRYRTTQGQMWDQIALEKLTDEHDMRDIVGQNPELADCLLLSGELRVNVPEKATADPVRTLPPWER